MKYAPDDSPLVDVVAAEHNRPFGHIALGQPDSAAAVTFTDEGPWLSVWGWGITSARLDQKAARNLAAELIAWADRKEGAVRNRRSQAIPDRMSGYKTARNLRLTETGPDHITTTRLDRGVTG